MGAINAEGIKNQLGRPALDRFVVLIREAAQNSWDARDPDTDKPLRFEIDLRALDDSRTEKWRKVLSTGAPENDHLPLRAALESRLSVLFVSDRGTVGLGGPTRADAVRERERHDYVSFVLNVGEPRDVEHGGGTYGFGKAVFFLASSASTILVYTRCRNGDGHAESRLAGCALGQAFSSRGRAHTGRHWFGLPTGSDDVVEPLIGDAADAIAEALDFPPFGDDFGTTIAVLAPNLHDLAPEAAVERMSHAVLWHLWPKIVDYGDGPAMRVAISLDGVEIELPEPTTHPAVRHFAAALKDLEDAGELITHGPGARPIGRIRLLTTFEPPPVVDEVASELGLDSGIRHCCLLRMPELVVEYRQGPAMPDERIWYAGVFKALPEVDTIFAQSEPPTHDAWVPDQLEDRERSIVRTTLRHIDKRLKSHAAPRTSEPIGGSADGLAGMSRILGGLLTPASGGGAGPTGGGNRSKTTRRSTIQMIGSPYWTDVDGQVVLAQPFEVTARRTVTLQAETAVRVWGGTEKADEAPLGADAPELIGWRRRDGPLHPPGRIAIEPTEGGRWEALVAVPADTMTRIRIREATVDQVGGDG
jgi:hypothetical protein